MLIARWNTKIAVWQKAMHISGSVRNVENSSVHNGDIIPIMNALCAGMRTGSFQRCAYGGWTYVYPPNRPGRPKRDMRESDAFAKYLLMPEESFATSEVYIVEVSYEQGCIIPN